MISKPESRAPVLSLSNGFTLIELLVVCAIMVVVTAIVLANNNIYGGQILLQNFAYDLALSIREAQVYGISVERFGTGASSNFNAGYGVHFSTSDPTHYELFADLNNTGLFNVNNSPDENAPSSPYAINRGYSIYALCVPAGTSLSDCTTPGSSLQASVLDIVFVRPEPDAYIAENGVQCYNTSSTCASSARIVLRSPRGDLMSVSVQANGQISVDQTSDITP